MEALSFLVNPERHVGDHSGGQHLRDSRYCDRGDGMVQPDPSKSIV